MLSVLEMSSRGHFPILFNVVEEATLLTHDYMQDGKGTWDDGR